MKYWINAVRPWTFPIYIIPIIDTLYWFKDVNKYNLILSIIWVIFLAIFTNLSNLYLDNYYGIDLNGKSNEVLINNNISIKNLKKFIFTSLIIILFLGIYLSKFNYLIMLAGIIGILLAFGYSYHPIGIKKNGYGELYCLLSFIGYHFGIQYLVAGKFSLKLFYHCFEYILITTLILLVNNIEDYDGDRNSKCNTLIVKIGKNNGKLIYYAGMLYSVIHTLYHNQLNYLQYILIIIGYILCNIRISRKMTALMLLITLYIRIY